jgi:CMP-N-acetylneuraminic acid synthetase
MQSEPFTKLGGNPLIWYTLKEVQEAETLDRIVLTSEDDEVLEYASQFPGITPLKRPVELAKSTSRVLDTVIYVLDILKQSSSYEPDAVCILYITTPLRRAYHIDKAVDTMTIFDVDSVISIQEELSNCYVHRENGLTPVNTSSCNLRIEREAIYKENGSIYLSKKNVIKNEELVGKRVGHITMLPEEGVKINSDFEFWMAERIITEWRLKRDKVTGLAI